MATISKFYLLDAATPNTGNLPTSAEPITSSWGSPETGAAADAYTVRDATDVPGSSNPDVESSFSSNANQNLQRWAHRRFISRPLAAQTIQGGVNGTWTLSYARYESNNAHNQVIICMVRVWRPTALHFVDYTLAYIVGTEGGLSEGYESVTDDGRGDDFNINNGDCLVFDILSYFTQSMSTSYTDYFCYDGTTEASTTTCASFVSPPSALTLFSGYTKAGWGKEGTP